MRKFDFKNMTYESAKDEIISLKYTNYGHNMIGLILGKISDKYGDDVAEKLRKETKPW
tara:strand:- start:1500 stop:1673 length:174 start_codon:yes stop_codon:yes gene_type:complete